MATPLSYEQLCQGAVSSVMSLLGNANEQELQQMLDDTEKLDNLIMDAPQFNSMRTEREMLLAQNKSLAEWNMSQEPKLKEAKQKLLDAYERAAQLKTDTEQLSRQLEQLSSSRSLDTTLNLLKVASAEAEEQSEKIVEQMQDGDMDVNQFTEQFIAHRQKFHMRKVKAEKLSELLQGQTYDHRQQARYPGQSHQGPPAVPSRQAPSMPQPWQGYPNIR